MPEIKTTPPPEQSQLPVKRRTGRPEEARQNRDGLLAAILLAFFLHLLLFWASPAEFFPEMQEQTLIPEVMELTLEPIPAQPENEEQYVRATPDVEEKIPEDTNNISDRNQQAAQEQQVPPSPDNTPYNEGDMEESNRLVQGNPFQEPVPPAPPAASQSNAQSPVPQQEAAPKEEVVEVEPDYIKQEPKEEEGVASIENPDKAREKPDKISPREEEVTVTSPNDGKGQAQMTTPAQAAASQTQVPRPRQRVERDTSYGPLKDNRQGAIWIGNLAFSAKYSEFGEYWRRVGEIIERRWRNLCYNTKSIPFGSGNNVVVTFSITREGQVTDVKVEQSTAGKLAETVSTDAIVGEAPFFEWTPEMIVRMGNKAPCAIHFFY